MTSTAEATTLVVHGATLRSRGGPLRVQRLDARSTSVRVALVPTSALLLAGDRVAVDIEVADGARLEIIEPGGTVAYDMRGGEASWDVRVRVGRAAALVWHAEPFVVASGAVVRRSLTVDLAGSGRAVVRETLVLGRSGEPAGRLDSTTTVEREGTPVLVERLLTGPGEPGLGRHRVLDQVLHLGDGERACPADPDATMRLESGDLVHRWLGAETHLSTVRPAGCARYSVSEE